MARLNEIRCNTFARTNTGVGTCNMELAPDIYDLLTPPGTRITATNADDIKAWLIAGLVHNDPKQRFYAIGRYSSTDENGEDEVRETYDDGTGKVQRNPTAVWLRTITDGVGCTGKNLNSFDQSQRRFNVFRIDKNFKLIGQTRYNDTTGMFEIGGYLPYEISSKMVVKPTFQTGAKYQIAFAYSNPKADENNTAILDLGNIGLDDVILRYNVQNMDLIEAAPSTVAGTFYVNVMGSCGNANLGLPENYGTIINSGALYSIIREDTGVTVAITSVTVNPATGVATFVLSATLPPTGTKLLLKSTGVTAWATAGMKYLESNVLTLKMVA